MPNNIVFKPAERVESRLNLGVSGTSGSGKTLAALRLAYGITGKWDKVFVIDTEHGSASLYQGDTRWGIGQFMHFNLDKPFSPARYILVIEAAIRAGAEVIVIDQISHAWSGTGGVLDIKEQAEKSGRYNSYTAWSVATPEHNRLFETILTSPVHMICTMRSKTEYTFDPSAKQKVKKLGLAPVQRNDIEYEWTVMMDLDRQTHKARTSKSRSPVVSDGEEYEIDEDLGKSFLKWLSSAAGYTPVSGNEEYTAPESAESRAQAAADAASGKPTRPKVETSTSSPSPEPSTSPTTQTEASSTEKTPSPTSSPTPSSSDEKTTEDHDPWLADGLSTEEARNIMYAVAVAEWDFSNTDEVRTAIMESAKWEGISTVGDVAEIAAYLQHQSVQKKAEAVA